MNHYSASQGPDAWGHLTNGSLYKSYPLNLANSLEIDNPGPGYGNPTTAWSWSGAPLAAGKGV